MKFFKTSCTLAMFCAAAICLNPSVVWAEIKVFTVDHSQSPVAMSGSFIGINLTPQAPGSLSTRYTGTIRVDLTGSTITFVGGSSVVASNNGTWQPAVGGAAGSAPANYGGTGNLGGFVTGFGAVRNLVLDSMSNPLPITGTNYPAQNVTIIIPTNAASAFDYRYSGLQNGSGTRQLANTSTNNIVTGGIISTQGSEIVLTFPVNADVYATVSSPNDVHIVLTGQVVARAPVASPVPLTINNFQVGSGQLTFTMATTSNQSYSILGSTNLINWSSTNDQFTATNSTTVRSISYPGLPRQYFRVRQN